MTIVLLPHPGPEREPSPRDSTRCPWPDSRDPHRRKFLRTIASYAADGGDCELERGAIGVWCEYEPPTNVGRPRGGGSARWLHTIDADAVALEQHPQARLNTDPWIWTEGFRWTICRRISKRELRVVDALQHGDVVVFGSAVGGRWLMDTVLVIESRVDTGPHPPAFVKCVMAPLAGLGFQRLRPHQGRPHCSSGPFSFAPVQTNNLDSPIQRLDITPLFAMLRKRDGTHPRPSNSRSLVACTADTTPAGFWTELVRVTRAAGLKLGVRFDHPLDQAPG